MAVSADNSLLALVTVRRHEILAAAARHGARNVRLFGSVARGTADADSDIDILVDLEPGASLVDRGALYADLAELLPVPVDVLAAAGINDSFRDQVLAEAIPL